MDRGAGLPSETVNPFHILRVLAVAVCSGLLGAARVPHPGPPVFLQVFVEDDQVRLVFTGEQETVMPWYGLDWPVSPPLDADVESRLRAGAEALLSRELVVRIDGEVVPLEPAGVAVFDDFGPANTEPSAEVKLRVAVAERPRRVEVSWTWYEGVEDATKRKLPVVIDAGGEFDLVTLTTEEPGYVWHADASSGSRAKRPGAVEALIPVEQERVPAFSIGVLVVGVVGAVLLRRRSAPLLSLGVLAACGGIALAGRDAWSVRAPWGTGRLPDETQAIAMFRELHRGVYGAFDAKSEGEIYDRLARCVDDALIDDLYGQVFESLVMREEGGAIAQVQAVDVLEGSVAFPERAAGESLAFDVDWTWSVRGRVIHYGHEHSRLNRYRARYRVAAVDDTWRIAAVDVLENERLPDPVEDE